MSNVSDIHAQYLYKSLSLDEHRSTTFILPCGEAYTNEHSPALGEGLTHVDDRIIALGRQHADGINQPLLP